MRVRALRPFAAFLALVLVAIVSSCGNSSSNRVRTASLDGADETPPNSSTATGSAFYKVQSNHQAIDFTLSVSNISNVVAAHIHVGPPGVAGPIIFPIANGSFTSLTGTLTESDFTPAPAAGIVTFEDGVNALLAGNTYTNVHTTQFPGGEIRGQNE